MIPKETQAWQRYAALMISLFEQMEWTGMVPNETRSLLGFRRGRRWTVGPTIRQFHDDKRNRP